MTLTSLKQCCEKSKLLLDGKINIVLEFGVFSNNFRWQLKKCKDYRAWSFKCWKMLTWD